MTWLGPDKISDDLNTKQDQIYNQTELILIDILEVLERIQAQLQHMTGLTLEANEGI